jgi:gamma-glutamyltranspeptidase / glutathione hydrolase
VEQEDGRARHEPCDATALMAFRTAPSRPPAVAAEGMVATSQPLATRAGLRALERGGNAVDAAIAAAAVLCVTEPMSTGIGGDAFALVWDGTHLHGLNGSGRAPLTLTADAVRARGHDSMPEHGWLPVTVPGAPAAWRDLHQRFGRLPFTQLIEPAASYAERGHPVSPISVWHWRWQAEDVHPRLTGPEFAAFFDVFASDGAAPKVGAVWRSPDMARSLRLIAETMADAVYTGEIAERIVDFSQATGGLIGRDDLESHTSTWVNPISTNYRGYDVWEMPPNTQGLAALAALNILEQFELERLPRDSDESFHVQIEAMKLAFADAHRHVADPDRHAVPVDALLAKDYAAGRAALIRDEALLATPGVPAPSDTVYLCAGDSSGMMVSFIQSSFDGFGSHVVVPGTGIVLQNRGAAFSLELDHPNLLEPGKRPFHTIIPGFLTRDGAAVGPFGVMGGHMQPQGHVQMVVNTVDYRMDPQTSLDQTRWLWRRDRSVLLEPSVDRAVLEALRRRGHAADVWNELDAWGRGQIIWRLPSGTYIAGSDHRGDGQAIGY